MGLAITRSIVGSHVVGKRQRQTRCNLSFHITDPGHGVIAISCLRCFGPPLSTSPLNRLPSHFVIPANYR
jgi:hypothetical protein